MVNSTSQEDIVFAEILVERHYYILQTVPSSKDFIFDWTESSHDRYILFLRCSYGTPKAFHAISQLEIICESDGASGSFKNEKYELNFHVGIVPISFDNFGILHYDNNNCSDLEAS